MPKEDKIRELKQLELFENLNHDVLEKIAPYFKKRLYHRNEIVYSNATSARHFIFIIEGKIKIFRLSELGKEQIIRLLERNEFTGELALFEGVRKAYATALKPTSVYIIEHSAFKDILTQYPEISLKMIEILSYRLHLSEEQTSTISTVTAKERLWNYLNKIKEQEHDSQIVHLKETKRFLASYLGMSSETLSRVLHQLEEEGRLIEHSDHYFEILDKN